MKLKQQNRFCGIVKKSEASPTISTHPLLNHSRKVDSLVSYFSSIPIQHDYLFDGCTNTTDFQAIESTGLAKLNGTWALATTSNGKILAARDKVGSRSIYYYESELYFCFSNEIKLLLELDFIPFKVSSSAAFRFLFLNDNNNQDDCLFEGILELPASHCLAYDVNRQRMNIERYYSFEQDGISHLDQDVIAEFLVSKIGALTNPIAEQNPKSAALLSGGIDSSVIAASIFQGENQNKIPFCTAMTDDESIDEIPFAASVVKQFGIENWNQILATNIDKELEQLHFAMELPTFSLGSYLQYELCRFAKHQDIKFLIDGTGADSLFAGHNYYKAIYWNSQIRSFSFGKLNRETKYYRNEGFWLKYYAKNMVKYAYLPRFSGSTKFRFYTRNNPLLRFLNPDFINENDELLKDKKEVNVKELNPFLADEFFGGGVRKLLRFLDRIGKHFGVMNRSIFIEDSELFEYALRIDPSLKIKNDQLKYILRYAYQDVLPVDILKRDDKKGLVAPNNQWLKENKALFMSYFEQDLSAYFEMAEIRAELSQAIDDLGAVEDFKLFKFFSFAIWHKVYNEKYNK